nr:relaxin-3 receptor 2-like [Pogona vitticeps]
MSRGSVAEATPPSYLSASPFPFAKMEASGLSETLWNHGSVTDPGLWNGSSEGDFNLEWDDGALGSSDVSFGLRIFITVVYSAVCAGGLLGNGLVMSLMWRQRKRGPMPVINIFVFALAVADFQFSLTLPFWAVETALDYSWVFGQAMCKVIPSFTVLSVYINAFLLTAMSVTRYWSVALAIKGGSRLTSEGAKWVNLALWTLALGATMPTIIYATVVDVAKEKLCIFKFPAPYLLGVYHLLRVVVTFVLPLSIISTSYLLLIRFLGTHHRRGDHSKRQKQVATTIRLIVGGFFLCWFPNHVVTFWGVLVKFKAVSVGKSFYFLHTYIFPLATCLAHSSSCLNPILYCLMRREFRQGMKDIFRRFSSMASSYRPFSSQKPWEDVVVLPLSPAVNARDPQMRGKEDSTFSTILEPGAAVRNLSLEMMPGVETPL